MSILIDGGSTHNFVHHRVVTTLRLTTTAMAPLRVTVGNGDELKCQQTCPNIEVTIQQHAFVIDFHVLPICGVDLVLGVQWLKTLGPVLTDYTTLTMKFMVVGHLVEWVIAMVESLRKLLQLTKVEMSFMHRSAFLLAT